MIGKLKLTVIESPYAPKDGRTVADHERYARACMADSLKRGEAPIASHLLYTQPGILDDTIPHERALGIEAGLQWGALAELSAFYVDCGWSSGMKAALERAKAEGRSVETRSLTGWAAA